MSPAVLEGAALQEKALLAKQAEARRLNDEAVKRMRALWNKDTGGAESLLKDCAAAGLSIRLQDREHLAVEPRERLTPDLRARLVELKAGVLARLRQASRPPVPADGDIWNQCGSCLEWRPSYLTFLSKRERIFLCDDCRKGRPFKTAIAVLKKDGS